MIGYIALSPLFAALRGIKLKTAPFYGFLYGAISYGLFNYWLGIFYPPAIIIIPSLYAFYYFLLFPALKGADMLFPKYGFIVQTLIWTGYEYLRTKGFLGYSYGIMGYTQYSFPLIARFSALTGVWGVSLLVVFPSAWLGKVFVNGRKDFLGEAKKLALSAAVYGAVLICALFYGIFTGKDYSECRSVKAALIQQNIDPWQGGEKTYRESLRRLKKISLDSLEKDPDIVIWSETSFVPSIDWHTKYRTEPAYYELVKDLRGFLSAQEVPYVIGNNEGVLGYDDERQLVRKDYNSALLFENGSIKDVYRKIHLVPFTEHFPYKKQFPFIYDFLVGWDTHFWEKGTEYTVFDSAGVKFSTPICFEDTFGDLSAMFVKKGAQVIINLSNDGWAYSVPAEMQHMAMAVFRACENRRSVVRSTNSGITCVIDPSGRITSFLEPFKEGYLVSDVAVYDEEVTFYTKFGDWLGIFCAYFSLILLSAASVRELTTKRKYRKIG